MSSSARSRRRSDLNCDSDFLECSFAVKTERSASANALHASSKRVVTECFVFADRGTKGAALGLRVDVVTNGECGKGSEGLGDGVGDGN